LVPNATGSASVVGTLSIAGPASSPTAVLDVNNGAAVIDYSGSSPVSTVRQQIIAGRGSVGLGGAWNGMGITSSAVATANAMEPESRSVGYAENSSMPLGPLTTFRGQAVDSTSILIAHTRTGDANLDGSVNDDDVTILGASYAPGVAGASWAVGDFDYNGFVDDDDVTLMGALYNPAAPPLATPALALGASAAVTEPGGVVSGSYALVAVPEPSTFFMSGVVVAILLVSRRLRSSCASPTRRRAIER
jgi:hypothetical protein